MRFKVLSVDHWDILRNLLMKNLFMFDFGFDHKDSYYDTFEI